MQWEAVVPLDLVATSQRGQTHDDQDRPQLFTPFFPFCPVFSVMHDLAARESKHAN